MLRKQKTRNRRIGFAGLLVAAILLGSPFIYKAQVARADTTGVVINELMYHPASDLDNDDFLELYNTSASAVNISGWCFEGITLCFANGTTIGAHAYLVVSRNSAQTLSTYGVTTAATYTGNLSNGGETITLRDGAVGVGAVVDSVAYGDQAPWPTKADGGGPSLELRDPQADNTLATSWGASVNNGGTPGSENSLVGYEPPVVSNVTQATDITANQQVIIRATVQEATDVSLVYKEMFNTDQSIVMYDDGGHGDSAAGDHIYGATIPGAAAATLIRYKVVAENAGGEMRAPSSDDSINYYGYRVASNLAAGTTPVLEWYIADDDYAELLDDVGGADDTYSPCVIVYGNQVFDNAKVRLKGSYSRTFDKKPFKVNLPKGYTLTIPGIIDTPVSEFHLNSDYPSGNRYVASLLAWRVFDYAGFSTPEKTKVELRRNGDIEGSYTFMEKYDEAWKQDNPLISTGALYENGGEKKWPKDGNVAPLHTWQQDLTDKQGEDLHNYIMATTNVPNIINFMAVQAVIRHNDWSHYQNSLAYQDTADTNRWSMLPWDLDLAFSTLPPFNPSNYPGTTNMIDPTDTTSSIPVETRMLFAAVWNDPVLKQMYTRRVRSLVDQVYVNGNIQQWLVEEYQKAQTAAERDDAVRHTSEEQEMRDYYTELFTNLGIDVNNPAQLQALIDASIPDDFPMPNYFNGDTLVTLPSPEQKIAIFNYGLEKQIPLYTNDYVNQGLIPEAQSPSAAVEIKKVEADGGDSGYLVLYNPGAEAVDISGWTISTPSITLPGGSVIPAGSEAYIPVKDNVFRQEHADSYLVLMQTNTTLLPAASLTLKRQDQSTADTYSYGFPADPGNPGQSAEQSPVRLATQTTSGGASPSSTEKIVAAVTQENSPVVKEPDSNDVPSNNSDESNKTQQGSGLNVIWIIAGLVGAAVLVKIALSSLQRRG